MSYNQPFLVLVISVFLATFLRRFRFFTYKPVVAEKHIQTPEKTPQKPPPVTPLHDFDWTLTPPIHYRPFKTKSHVTMGIMKSSRDEWIRMDRGYLDRINIRKQLIETHPDPDTIVGTGPLVNPAIEELYQEILINHLSQRYPTMFRIQDEILTNLVTGRTYPATTKGIDHATMLKYLAENVEEDFYFMCPDSKGDFRLQGYIACFPGGFLSPAKRGMSVRAIHEPVPGYEQRLGNSVDRYFRRMEPGMFIGRMNWSLQTDGIDLFRLDGNNFYPEGETDLEVEEEDTDISITYLRVEHQTLTCLPKTGAIMFCVRSYMTSLKDIRDEGSGSELADAIESMPEKLGIYKKRPFWGKKVCAWLREDVKTN